MHLVQAVLLSSEESNISYWSVYTQPVVVLI